VAALSPEMFIVDAIVISDYNKGLVSYELIEELRTVFHGPIFIDTKKTDLQRFNGCIVKINELEYKNSVSVNDSLIVTLGDKGACYKTPETEIRCPSEQVEVTDVCGAGDTFLASLVYKYLLTNSMTDSIEFANRAASVTVRHMGVYAPTIEEIK
jgi:D-beta-D-heptose 7-phosphate kinase/D-beta-D-heptose 1-phosphate adenosyltransferase